MSYRDFYNVEITQEEETCLIENALLIALGKLPAKKEYFDKDAYCDIYRYCYDRFDRLKESVSEDILSMNPNQDSELVFLEIEALLKGIPEKKKTRLVKEAYDKSDEYLKKKIERSRHRMEKRAQIDSIAEAILAYEERFSRSTNDTMEAFKLPLNQLKKSLMVELGELTYANDVISVSEALEVIYKKILEQTKCVDNKKSSVPLELPVFFLTDLERVIKEIKYQESVKEFNSSLEELNLDQLQGLWKIVTTLTGALKSTHNRTTFSNQQPEEQIENKEDKRIKRRGLLRKIFRS